MNVKLQIISVFYKEYLEEFYNKYQNTNELTYNEHYNLLISEAAESGASYTNNFNAIGIETRAIVSNNRNLQQKWAEENNSYDLTNEDLIIKQIDSFQPNTIWLEDKNLLNKKFIGRIRNECSYVNLIFTYHCAPFAPEFAEKLKLVDFVLTCTPGFIENYVRIGVKSYLIYHGFDSLVLNKLPEKREIVENLTFSGSLYLGGGYHDQRTRIIEKILQNGISIGIYGNLESNTRTIAKRLVYQAYKFLKNLGLNKIKTIELFFKRYENFLNTPIKGYSKELKKSAHRPVFGIEMYKLLHSSNITLNIHGEVAGDYAGNLRMFEATGVGTCLLTDNKSNMRDLFDLDNEVVVYDNEDDCIEKIKWLLANPEICKKIAIAGQKKTLAQHTIENRCKLIHEIILKVIGN